MSIAIKLIGAIGLIIITHAIFIKKETLQDESFILGGFCLLVYSIYLKDPIFIPLQIIFILASAYEMWKLKHEK